MLPVGTLANVAAVIVGGTIGVLLSGKMPERCRSIVFQGLGLCTLVIGVSMALQMQKPLPLIFSVVLGGVIGELARIEDAFQKGALWLKKRLKSDNALFTEGMITAFLIFCVGPMTILGSFDEGLRQDPTLLYTKSMLDGFASIALAATYGLGVIFSVLPLLLYQLGLTYFAASLQGLFTEPLIAQLTATGGVLILGIGFNLLEIKAIRIANLLPALLLVVLLSVII